MYNKDKINPAELSTYEDLTNPKWEGQICVRSSSNIYNQSLLASLLAYNGASKAEQWAKGIVSNMARPPKGNDRSQMSGAAVGECNIAIANTYYLGNWLTSSDAKELEMASKLGVFFPNQDSRGAHINVSGAAITRHAKNKENALTLLEYLLSDKAQQWYAQANHEYPVKPGVDVSPTVKSLGYPFKADNLNLNRLGELNTAAVKIFDRAGWQ